MATSCGQGVPPFPPPPPPPTFLLPAPPRLGVAAARAAQALGGQGPQARGQVGQRAQGARAGGGRSLAVLAQRVRLQGRQLSQQCGARLRRQLVPEAQEVLLARALQPRTHVPFRGHVAAATAGPAGTRDPRALSDRSHGTRERQFRTPTPPRPSGPAPRPAPSSAVQERVLALPPRQPASALLASVGPCP